MLPFTIVNCTVRVIEAEFILDNGNGNRAFILLKLKINNLTIENFVCILSSHLHDNSVLGPKQLF